jgi:hypothetical protein
MAARAAQMWEDLAFYQDAAQSYKEAGDTLRDRDKTSAVEYYFKASRLFWRLETPNPIEEQECLRKASELGKWPRLHIIKKNTPTLTQYRPGLHTIRLENKGFSTAINLAFTIGGSLKEQLKFQVLNPLERDQYFDLSFELVPTRPQSLLEIEVAYNEVCNDQSKPHDLRASLVSEIEAAQPPHMIRMGDSVKSTIKITNPDNQPLDLTIGDTVCTSLDIQFGEAVA